MSSLDAAAFSQRLVLEVRGYVDRATAPLLAKIAELEAEIKLMAQREPAKDGKDGRDGEKGDSGEKGDRGEPGEKGETGEAGAQGDPGVAGPRGADAEPGPKGDRGEKGEPGDPGKDGERGMKGLDGQHGRDALELHILPAIDETRSYPRATFAIKDGGLWRSHEPTAGMKGWECLVNGLADLELVDGADGRPEAVCRLSDGTERRKAIPAIIYRDVYRDDADYARGDMATFGGSLWHANAQTKERPGTGTDWTLVAKRGRDGKDAEPAPAAPQPVKLR